MIETLKNYLFYLKYQKNYSIKTIDSYQRDIEKGNLTKQEALEIY